MSLHWGGKGPGHTSRRSQNAAGTDPAPFNTNVAWIGDSITAQSLGSAGGGYTPFASRGAAYWARAHSRQRFRTPSSFVKGTSGNTTTQMLARITDVTGLSAGTVVIQGGVNDFAADASLATVTGNFESMIAACRAANQIVVLQGPHPMGSGTSLTAGQLARWSQLRDWMIARHNPLGGVWSNKSAWDDIAATPGGDVATAAMLMDAIHPGPRGSYYLGLRLSQMLDSLYAASEPWDAGSNLITNPNLTGTGGTKSNGVTGSVADNYTGTSSAALSGDQVILASLPTIGGKVWQQFRVTGTWAGNASLSLIGANSGFGTTWNVGNVGNVAFDVEIDAPASGTPLSLQCGTFYQAGVFQGDGNDSSSLVYPNVAYAVIPSLYQFTLPSGSTRMQPYATLQWAAGTLDLTVRFSHPYLQKTA